MSRRFNGELFAENLVGFLFGALVLVGIVLSAFWITQDKPVSATTAPTLSMPKAEPKPVLKASSIDGVEIEKLYQKKRDEIAAKKAAEAKRIADENARIVAEKQRLKALEEKKQREAAAERQRLVAEKEKLAQEKRQALARAKQEKQRIADERKRLEQEKKAAEIATKKAAEAKKKAELAAKKAAEKKRQADAARKQAEKKKQEAEAARQKAVAEKKAKAAAKRAAEQKAKAKAAKEAKKAAERKARLAKEKKAKAEAARQAKAAEKKRIADELAASIAAIEKKEANDKAKANAIARFGQAITSKIRRSWRIPPKLPVGLKATFKIRTTTSGNVKSIRVIRSSGNRAFDNSAKEAIHRAVPLPMPKKVEWAKEFRDITIRFPE